MKLHDKNLVMDEFIQIYENALDPNICDQLVSIFEQLNGKHLQVIDDNIKCIELNLTENRDLFPELSTIHNEIVKKIIQYRDIYYEYIDKRVFPNEHTFEMIRIKKYNPGGEDQHDTHVDVTNHLSAKRFLAFTWYLNDVDHGGNTVFRDLTINPKRGKLVVFPPLWLYPYREESPASGPKYVMNAYLHYK